MAHNPRNPRDAYDDIDELTLSIKEYGILQLDAAARAAAEAPWIQPMLWPVPARCRRARAGAGNSLPRRRPREGLSVGSGN